MMRYLMSLTSSDISQLLLSLQLSRIRLNQIEEYHLVARENLSRWPGRARRVKGGRLSPRQPLPDDRLRLHEPSLLQARPSWLVCAQLPLPWTRSGRGHVDGRRPSFPVTSAGRRMPSVPPLYLLALGQDQRRREHRVSHTSARRANAGTVGTRYVLHARLRHPPPFEQAHWLTIRLAFFTQHGETLSDHAQMHDASLNTASFERRGLLNPPTPSSTLLLLTLRVVCHDLLRDPARNVLPVRVDSQVAFLLELLHEPYAGPQPARQLPPGRSSESSSLLSSRRRRTITDWPPPSGPLIPETDGSPTRVQGLSSQPVPPRLRQM